jgi:outer membrane protein with beta-barrel domain
LEVPAVNSSVVRFTLVALAALLLTPRAARAQADDTRWNVEATVGWDIGLSGDFLAAGIGTINGVPIVIQTQSFNEVYGTGVQWQFGAGYKLDEDAEVHGQFTYQRSAADAVLVGKAGASDLYATFEDYEVWSLEAGYRRYFEHRGKVRPYAGVTLGIADIPRINGAFAATQASAVQFSTDLYDGTAAFIFGVNGGLLYRLTDRTDFKAQIGFRRTSGLAQIDDLASTGLGDINDRSARWSMPIAFGIHVRF